MKEYWLTAPEDHDYPAAANYLSLIFFSVGDVTEIVGKLKKASIVTFKAKDILRASELPPLDLKQPEVAEDLQKIKEKKKLSPILLVRGNHHKNQKLIIADGYHRVCASYINDGNQDIPCKIISF